MPETALNPTCHVHLLGGGLRHLLQRRNAQVNVYNDHDSALNTLFTVVRADSGALVDALAGRLSVPRFQQAAETYQQLHAAWYGHPLNPHSLSAQATLHALRPVHAQLRTVLIEHLPWAALLARYADSRTAFYVDAAQFTPQIGRALAATHSRWTLLTPLPTPCAAQGPGTPPQERAPQPGPGPEPAGGPRNAARSVFQKTARPDTGQGH